MPTEETPGGRRLRRHFGIIFAIFAFVIVAIFIGFNVTHYKQAKQIEAQPDNAVGAPART